MTKATVAAIKRPEEPPGQEKDIFKRPGPKKIIISCSIKGVPLTIQTIVRTTLRRGPKRLIDPKAITSPKGSENISVKAKSSKLSKKLSDSRLTIT